MIFKQIQKNVFFFFENSLKCENLSFWNKRQTWSLISFSRCCDVMSRLLSKEEGNTPHPPPRFFVELWAGADWRSAQWKTVISSNLWGHSSPVALLCRNPWPLRKIMFSCTLHSTQMNHNTTIMACSPQSFPPCKRYLKVTSCDAQRSVRAAISIH